MNQGDIRIFVEKVLTEEIEFLKTVSQGLVIDLVRWLDSDDKKAINVYLKKNGLWQYTKSKEGKNEI